MYYNCQISQSFHSFEMTVFLSSFKLSHPQYAGILQSTMSSMIMILGGILFRVSLRPQSCLDCYSSLIHQITGFLCPVVVIAD